LPQLPKKRLKASSKNNISGSEAALMKKSEKTKNNEPIIICVCGLAGSGKSTLAKKLAEKYGLKYYSGGDALKALATEEGYKPLEHGWWESQEGMRFLEKRGRDPKFDKMVDMKLLELARRGNVILDSWTMPWLLEKGFKIWLEASPEKRAERIAKRDGMSVKEALAALSKKEKQTKEIYKKLYGFSLGEDFAPFHLILDTENLKAEEVFQTLCSVIDKMVLHKRNLE
jgi:cytidylate kinase